MREWTREERYRPVRDPEEIRALHERISRSAYRQTYHVQPLTGLSCDPNGFVRYDGAWHLCYQWFPWGAEHGLKYWYHVSSPDLLHWKNEGIALAPDRMCDNCGVYSGSAIVIDGRLCVFYTGNHRDEDWTRVPYTCAAALGADGTLKKLDAPLFGPRAGYTEHQRDPKIVWVESRREYFIFLGAQSDDGRGCALVYRSVQPLKEWSFAGRLNVPGYEDFGGMWECPCMTSVGGKDMLIFSPQHIKLPGRGESTNHNVCLLGTMDYDTLTFTPDGPYRFLDYGFDFYAAQSAANTGNPEKALLTAWVGLPDNHYPTQEEDWEGGLTLPRELSLKDGRLRQTPLAGVEALRGSELPANGELPAACEMIVAVPAGDFDLNLFTGENGAGGMRLHYDAARKVCTIDRSGMDRRFNQQVFEVLDMPLDTPLSVLRIFIDRCTTEYFANDGEAVFTTHSYPTAREFHYTASAGVNVRLWALKRAVEDDFVI